MSLRPVGYIVPTQPGMFLKKTKSPGLLTYMNKNSTHLPGIYYLLKSGRYLFSHR